jgi:hypothetical protein
MLCTWVLTLKNRYSKLTTKMIDAVSGNDCKILHNTGFEPTTSGAERICNVLTLKVCQNQFVFSKITHKFQSNAVKQTLMFSNRRILEGEMNKIWAYPLDVVDQAFGMSARVHVRTEKYRANGVLWGYSSELLFVTVYGRQNWFLKLLRASDQLRWRTTVQIRSLTPLPQFTQNNLNRR